MKLLSYTEYLRANWKTLLVENTERVNEGTNTKQFLIEGYCKYLLKNGVEKFKVDYIISYLHKMNDVGIYGRGKIEDYSEEVYQNIQEIIDWIFNKYIKNENKLRFRWNFNGTANTKNMQKICKTWRRNIYNHFKS